MSFIEILTAVLLILGSLLCIALIFYIGKIARSIQQVQKNLSDITIKITPLLSSLSELSDRLSELSTEALSQLNVSRRIVNNVKERFDKILELEEKIRWGIEDPITKLLNSLKAVSNGISTFFNHLKK